MQPKEAPWTYKFISVIFRYALTQLTLQSNAAIKELNRIKEKVRLIWSSSTAFKEPEVTVTCLS
jgi:hypothetical protein